MTPPYRAPSSSLCAAPPAYIKAAFAEIPMLAALIERETRDSIELRNGAVVEVHNNDFRHIRRVEGCLGSLATQI